jgi:aspartate/tyrosine/aromatic aminotransferase
MQAAVRMFVENGMECLIAQSFAKNLGLYGERIGCASIVCRSPAIAAAVDSQMRIVVRPMYSNPPVHGARIVVKVLGNPQLFEEWKKEMRDMSGRIKEMRQVLFDELKKLGTPSISGDWSHIKSQIGMFSYTGLTAAQVDNITKRHHVYMLKDGRISMAGLNRKNVAHMAKAMDDVIRNP